MRQIKAARALLGWRQSELDRGGRRFPAYNSTARAHAGQAIGRAESAQIVAAIQSAGVEFIAENGGGRDVRLKKGREPETIRLEDLNASNHE
jgi:hypothetical protein